mmetsp:Transcript_86486/g.172617  ORF Transcript_86486/g.172617 Transcript_86486/m.172617 type:complete len:179 (-) Transcript_86486:282-818(-)
MGVAQWQGQPWDVPAVFEETVSSLTPPDKRAVELPGEMAAWRPMKCEGIAPLANEAGLSPREAPSRSPREMADCEEGGRTPIARRSAAMTAGSVELWPKPGGSCCASSRNEASASRQVVAVVLVPVDRWDSDRAEAEWGEPGRQALRPTDDSVPVNERPMAEESAEDPPSEKTERPSE